MEDEKLTFIQKILNIEKKFAWSFIGVLLAVVFGILGLYSTFFYTEKPLLSIETITQTDVVKLSEDINDLAILYDGRNIRESNMNLKLLTFKVVNRGNKSITEHSYASLSRFRLSVSNGNIIESPLIIEASNDYLKKLPAIELDSLKRSLYPPIAIIEGGEYYNIKVLVLHQKEKLPIFSVQGKIEGQNNIEILDRESIEDKKEDSGVEKFIEVISYIAIILVSYYILKFLVVRFVTFYRKNKLSTYIFENSITLNSQLEKIFTIYTENINDIDDVLEWTIKDIEEAINVFDNDEVENTAIFFKEKYGISGNNFDKKKIWEIRQALDMIRLNYVDIDNTSKEKISSDIEILEGFVDYVRRKKRTKEEESLTDKKVV